jgi:mycothiol synthase
VTVAEQFTFRRPAAGELEKAAAVFAAEEEEVRGSVTMGADELRDWWRGFNLAEGSWFVEDETGEPIAFCGSFERGTDFESWIAVRPEHCGRGLSTELLRRAERRARDLGGGVLRVGMLAENDRARALLESLGFNEVRRFYRMQIDFDGELPPPVPVDGITIATFRIEQARAFHAATNEAFADDWGFHPTPFEEWETRRLHAPETDTSLWFIAWDDDQIAGVIRCDGTKFSGGFVGVLGVRAPWRGRGIGMALLRRAFAEYHRRGASHVSLGVDAQNPTGATRLYERAGMRVVSEDIVFEKKLE